MRYIAAVLSVILIAATGCITVNVPLGGGDVGPSYQWILKWAPPEEQRTPSSSIPIRIKDMEAAGSYQLSAMIVVNADGVLRESSDNRWAARPGALLSEMLSRDIMAECSFPAVFRTAASVSDVLTVEGYVREFGATQIDSTTWIAVLDVDVTLLGNRGAEIIMQKNYRYQRRLPSPGFSELAEQLSLLGAIWSEEVRSDFHTVLP